MTYQEQWFNDDIIKDYVTLLSEKYRNEAIEYADSFIPVLLSSRIKTNDRASIEQLCKGMYKNSNLETKDKWIVPISLDNVHWILCIVMIKYHKILVYDSKHSDISSMRTNILCYVDKIRDFLSLYGCVNDVHHFHELPWLTTMMPFFSIQQDDYTCATNVMIVAHIASIIGEDFAPYNISIKNVTEIHEKFYKLYYRSGRYNLTTLCASDRLQLLDINNLTKENIIQWKEVWSGEKFDVLQLSESCNNTNINILHYPLSISEKNRIYYKNVTSQAKINQNIGVLAEKQSLYSSKGTEYKKYTEKLPIFTITTVMKVNDPFAMINKHSFESAIRSLLNVIQRYGNSGLILSIYNTLTFGRTPLFLEFGICSVFFEEFSHIFAGLQLNFHQPFSRANRILVPFQDYDRPSILESLENYKNDIHHIIDKNDCMYILKSIYNDVKIGLWDHTESWLESNTQTYCIDLLICSSQSILLQHYRDYIRHTTKNVWLVVVLFAKKMKLICFQVVRKGKQFKDRNEWEKEPLCGYQVLKNLLYPMYEEEKIDRIWQKYDSVGFSIIDDNDIYK